jgi:AhpD family alkylhydroperoxidase
MQARMKNPALSIPGALDALHAVSRLTKNTGVPARTLGLTHLRASQINGCSFCVEMHAKELRKEGETDERLFGVAAWRESLHFSAAERAALELTEAMSRLADRSDAVPDSIWEEARRHYDEQALASLLLSISLVNLWNRLNVATRQVAGKLPA